MHLKRAYNRPESGLGFNFFGGFINFMTKPAVVKLMKLHDKLPSSKIESAVGKVTSIDKLLTWVEKVAWNHPVIRQGHTVTRLIDPGAYYLQRPGGLFHRDPVAPIQLAVPAVIQPLPVYDDTGRLVTDGSAPAAKTPVPLSKKLVTAGLVALALL